MGENKTDVSLSLAGGSLIERYAPNGQGHMFTMKKRTILWVVLGLCATSVTAFAAWKLCCAAVPTSYVHVTYATELGDDRKLAGFADNVFFGRVERRRGQVAGLIPTTQSQVTVLETLKGSVSGSVAVSQHGGTDRFCVKVRMADDPHLMEPGKSYLLFTRLSASRGWHSVVSGFGKYELAAPQDSD